MSPNELSAIASERLGANWQTPLARLLNVNPRTVRRWASGASPITASMESMIQAALEPSPHDVKCPHCGATFIPA